MINYNFHQHSNFSDGKEAPVKYVNQALRLGFSAIGFSEHSPLPFANNFSLKEESIDNYITETDRLKEEMKGKLDVYRALEMDFIPGVSEDFDYWRNRCKVDYLIGSVHLVKPWGYDLLWFTDGPDPKIYDHGIDHFFDGDIKKAVKAFYYQTNEMIESQEFDIIGHFDKVKMHNQNRYFTEDEVWYRKLVDETIELIKQRGLIVEVNTRGLYKKRSGSLFPDGYALKRVQESGIPVIISSDAHEPKELNGLFSYAEQKLIDYGFKETMFFEQGQWISNPIHYSANLKNA
jgi:histidinol-phosphatase (PHP family)